MLRVLDMYISRIKRPWFHGAGSCGVIVRSVGCKCLRTARARGRGWQVLSSRYSLLCSGVLCAEALEAFLVGEAACIVLHGRNHQA